MIYPQLPMLLEKGKENLKTNIGEGQRLSIVDKGKQHNTQQELAKELGWSTGKVAMADAIDEALESGEAVGVHGGYQLGNQPIHGAEVDRWRKLRAIPDDARQVWL